LLQVLAKPVLRGQRSPSLHNGILCIQYKIDESTDKVVRIQLKYDVNRRDIIEKFI